MTAAPVTTAPIPTSPRCAPATWTAPCSACWRSPPASTAATPSSTALVCQVHTGLSIEDEARLFYDIDTPPQDTQMVGPLARPPRRRRPHVLAIDEVLKRHQLRIDPAPRDGKHPRRATIAVETFVEDLDDLQDGYMSTAA
jgi:hypothetical protein